MIALHYGTHALGQQRRVVRASHSPEDKPEMASVARNTHACGQPSVPAGTNNSAPMTTIQIRV
jgi:hypothetical protein